MTPEQKAAFVIAQAVTAYAEIEGMKTLNREREAEGKALAYDEGAFFEITNRYNLHNNALIDFFRD